MSYAAMAAIRGSGLEDATLVDVLEALAFCMNDQTGKCCPSTETIARIARRSPNVVRQTIKRLEADGFIAVSQLPGRERHFKLFLDRLPVADPLSEVEGVTEVKPLSEVTGDPFQKCEGTPYRSERGPLSEVKPEQGSEQGSEQGIEQGSCVAFVCDDATAPAEKVHSLVLESENPKPKPKRKRDPLVPCPETLPDEWREAAKIARPDVDPIVVWRKFWARYGPTSEKKALKTWKRMFLGWIGREYGSTYAGQSRFAGGAPRRYVDERYRGEDGDEIDYTYGIGKDGRPLRMG